MVGATPQEMLDAGYRQVGRDFPVFLHPETGEEYALARTERKTGPGYRGFELAFSPDVTLEEDLRRRDLTINAMARGADGALIDPYGGRADLEARKLRHVSEAFNEDPVRILRVARFLARYEPLGFAIAPETLARMRAMVAAGEADSLVPERSWQETAQGARGACARRLAAGAARLRRPGAHLPRARRALGRAAAGKMAPGDRHRPAHGARDAGGRRAHAGARASASRR